MSHAKTILIFILCSASIFIYCQSNKPITEATPLYANLHDTVKYVGMETCKGCHQDIYDTFIETGMGQSFGHATPEKSKGKYGDHVIIHDSTSGYYYHPFFRSDSLFFLEYQLDELGDTSYQREQHIAYIVGSGHHTNSHIVEDNGYLYQAPITFYTQKGIWDLAPGFDGGSNSRFSRIINLECMSCHNTLPAFIEGSENKYRHIPKGISCERCHGPGEAHVLEKQAGIIIDTSKAVDYSIVNPAKLPSRELKMSVCQRCHLQGVSILEDQKNYDDFKPGMHLTDVMHVFLPEFDGHQTQFIMASQAHRLTKSLCYQKSDMTCLSCHNPHVSVQVTPRQQFNDKCGGCHSDTETGKDDCSLELKQRTAKNKNDCSACHMPESPSIDIPHVTVTDHYIRRPIPEAEKDQIEQFIGLFNVTGGKVDALTHAKAFLHYYEAYSPRPAYLDSAANLLQQSSEKNIFKRFPISVHLHYLQKDYATIRQKAKKINLANIKDGWTAYRVGEAYLDDGQYPKAESYFLRALDFIPLNLDFKNKLATAYLQQNKVEAARRELESLIKESPQHLSALTNLGFCYLQLGQVQKANELYDQALQLDPNYVNALLNKVGLHLMRSEKKQAKDLLKKVRKLDPQNQKAQDLWRSLNMGR